MLQKCVLKNYLKNSVVSPNCKQLDRDRILDYLDTHPVSCVDVIIQESGAEPLRVYPLLFELVQEKVIRVVEETGWGIPAKVELMKVMQNTDGC